MNTDTPSTLRPTGSTSAKTAVRLVLCPMCGSNDLHLYKNDLGWRIHCHGCDLQTTYFLWKSQCVLHWNTRASIPPNTADEQVLQCIDGQGPCSQEHAREAGISCEGCGG